MAHCASSSAISRNYIGLTSYDLRHRTGYDSAGRGIHGGQHSEHVNSTFATQCDNWIKNLNFWTTNYPPYSSNWNVDWVGDVGLGLCKPDSMHGSARAFDLTRIQFANSTYVDMNWSWKSSNTTLQQRRYLAVAAQCRRYFQTVISAYLSETAHDNHIHFDNELTVGALRTNNSKDVVIVQKACNLLNGEALVVDGIWGSKTSAAYGRLLSAFNMSCKNPLSSKTDAVVFLSYVVRTAFANKNAGTYRSTC